MGLLPECARLPGYEPLNSYLGDGSNELKRRQLAERIAGVFDQYVVHRQEMVLGWEEGPPPDEARDERWQADLWRRLFAGGRPAHHAALAARLLAEIDSLPPERLAKLPSRISLFGMATLPPLYVRVLYALSRHIEIDFFVLNPSRYFWGDIASAREQARIARRLKSGIPVADRHLYAGNGLLASMGRVGRDFLFRGSSMPTRPWISSMISPIPAPGTRQRSSVSSRMIYGSSSTGVRPMILRRRRRGRSPRAMNRSAYIHATVPCGRWRCSTITCSTCSRNVPTSNRTTWL